MIKTTIKHITFIFLLLGLFLSGCKSSQNSGINKEGASHQAMEKFKYVSPDIVQGSVPPENKNITMYYIVQNGDTLEKIAKKIYGNPAAWKTLAKMNNLKNANQIYTGDFIHYELTPETKSFADSYANVPKSKIMVKSGDSLAEIARSIYGTESEWRSLWKENPQIKNPDRLIQGQILFFKARDITYRPRTALIEKSDKEATFKKSNKSQESKMIEEKKATKTVADEMDDLILVPIQE
jgi:LysM repeat protein